MFMAQLISPEKQWAIFRALSQVVTANWNWGGLVLKFYFRVIYTFYATSSLGFISFIRHGIFKEINKRK